MPNPATPSKSAQGLQGLLVGLQKAVTGLTTSTKRRKTVAETAADQAMPPAPAVLQSPTGRPYRLTPSEAGDDVDFESASEILTTEEVAQLAILVGRLTERLQGLAEAPPAPVTPTQPDAQTATQPAAAAASAAAASAAAAPVARRPQA